MRDFRNAKAMAQALRAALAAKDLKITISQNLELVAEFGVADWNTLAAKISHGERPMAREKVSSLPLPTVASNSVPPLSASGASNGSSGLPAAPTKLPLALGVPAGKLPAAR